MFNREFKLLIELPGGVVGATYRFCPLNRTVYLCGPNNLDTELPEVVAQYFFHVIQTTQKYFE